MRKYLKFIILILVSLFIFWFIGRSLDWNEVINSLRKANKLYLTVAFLIICMGYFLRAVRWKVLLAPITPSSLRELFATTTVGYTAMFIVGRAGEIVRPMWLPMRDKRVRPSAALVTIFVERVFDLASLICFFSISLIWFKAPQGHESDFNSIKLAGNLMAAAVVAGSVSLVIYHFYSAKFIGWADSLTNFRLVPAKVKDIILSLMRQLATSLNILRSPKEIFWATFWTIALWFSIAIPTWLALLAFDLKLDFIDSIFVMGVASLGSLVPTPGGAAGPFHAATMGSLLLLSIDRETSAAVSIIMHLLYFVPAVFFGLYYLFHGDISIERFRSLLSSENAEKEIKSDSPDFDE